MTDENRQLLEWARCYREAMRASNTDYTKMGRIVQLAIDALETEPNESRELSFARTILSGRVPSEETVILAQDTIARAKRAKQS